MVGGGGGWEGSLTGSCGDRSNWIPEGFGIDRAAVRGEEAGPAAWNGPERIRMEGRGMKTGEGRNREEEREREKERKMKGENEMKPDQVSEFNLRPTEDGHGYLRLAILLFAVCLDLFFYFLLFFLSRILCRGLFAYNEPFKTNGRYPIPSPEAMILRSNFRPLLSLPSIPSYPNGSFAPYGFNP